MSDVKEPRRFRTLFLSDIHLGTKDCQAGLLIDFLKHNEADTIYLVGDIIDGWRLKSGWYWPQAQNDVVQKLLRQARKGVKIYYTPGNHDEFARDFLGIFFGGVEIIDHAIHETADGKRLLVIHGDQFDVVVKHARWLAFLGDWAYEFALWANRWFNQIRRSFGFPYWSLSAWAKLKVKNAVSFIGDYESALADAARRHQTDGVVCGHIHHAAIRDIDGMLYVNTGDFVESCTAVAEHANGTLEILHWQATAAEQAQANALAQARLPGRQAAA
ncbi:UDP-2,3-diacylglucosamine diphosphatase [Methylocella silvestris]|uniref:UDP-2,3-diacylglucosamine hydrolase n=1 Tax=Methylocella silvestris TaxID=199596 RepID=A0A2J7TJ72_METSI|nr:UDP-2,3-diacylglucosamine diphosphatase [Methylocella silvestris]PNG26823.1 UDP-2,3-diacylglucosamine hydrolase [Methylocella silvestris]